MQVFEGKSVFEGIAIGKLRIFRHEKRDVTDAQGEGFEAEKAKFIAAREKAVGILRKLCDAALQNVGSDSAEIFEMHIMMTEDLDLEDAVTENLTQGYNAAYAVEQAGFSLSQIFSSMDDAYMKARSVDILDVSGRIRDCILGVEQDAITLTEPSVLAASDFTPSEVVQLDKQKLLGFVTTFGSDNSHTAILARTMALPSVVNIGVSVSQEFDGCTVVVDGFTGKVYVDPDQKTLDAYTKKQRDLAEERERLAVLKNAESVSLDGVKTFVYCNVGKSADCDLANENGAEGIGLFRSEFLYLEASDYPSEEVQFAEYRAAVEKMQGKPVVIRTMDIGADKQAAYFQLPKEENPALGYRSVRICFDRPQIMKTQLRALYRASAYGKLSVMVPMIISADEVRWVRSVADEVKSELKKEGVAFDAEMPIGIMIETPAAAMIADELAEVADFFSVGTNDLTQYTLAIDRQNQNLEKFYNSRHKAVLRLIKRAADCIHAKGKWIGICGELARDFGLTEFFLKIGIDELSVSPPYILKLRDTVQKTDTRKVDLSHYI
ncbi:MAG: phosphoenolpyruvate--protein phosphotransferase [Clostridiales bacterium]|nr:phosphoenolpyruvate--protein phosphotransferase [Clostridiales bacterium]